MRDVSFKVHTQRIANASAVLNMRSESVQMVQYNKGPKPDILATARAAGYLAVKNTPGVIPHCHPIPIEDVTINFEFGETEIKVLIEVKTIYKTGCEVEAMHGAAVAALTIYDMMKPVDKEIEIGNIKLESKSGGKTDFGKSYPKGLSAAVIVCSDSIAAGKKEDKAGKAILSKLENYELAIAGYEIIPDEPETIKANVTRLNKSGVNLILLTGGTGLSPRDNTPEALKEILEREIPGISETIRDYGQQRTPYSMLSRCVAGLIGKSLVIALPGSTKGASESMDALFPAVMHIFKVLDIGYKHQDLK